jgi:hypothetical protein
MAYSLEWPVQDDQYGSRKPERQLANKLGNRRHAAGGSADRDDVRLRLPRSTRVHAAYQ